MVQRLEDPHRGPPDPGTHLARQRFLPQDRAQERQSDGQCHHPHDGRHHQLVGGLAHEQQQDDGGHGQHEFPEYVPDAAHPHHERDIRAAVAVRQQHLVGEAERDRAPGRHGVRNRVCGLRDLGRRPEAKPGKRGHVDQPEGDHRQDRGDDQEDEDHGVHGRERRADGLIVRHLRDQESEHQHQHDAGQQPPDGDVPRPMALLWVLRRTR